MTFLFEIFLFRSNISLFYTLNKFTYPVNLVPGSSTRGRYERGFD